MWQGEITPRCLTWWTGAVRWDRFYEILKGEWGAAGVGKMKDNVFIGIIDEVALRVKKMRGEGTGKKERNLLP
jgi:hypothetical protein